MNVENRRYVIISFILFVGIMYFFRLFYMQVLDDTWSNRAHQISEKRREVTPPRAIIYDRNGVKIVGNKTYFNLMVIEEKMGENFDTLAFSDLIGWSVDEVNNRFTTLSFIAVNGTPPSAIPDNIMATARHLLLV